mmetsp:Transcript_43593/g.98396  ORF Transcript_43593/g.98396 Transcript_43593/m.98396 type:complete len:469 (+) Transcript_43593:126-1532(+)
MGSKGDCARGPWKVLRYRGSSQGLAERLGQDLLDDSEALLEVYRFLRSWPERLKTPKGRSLLDGFLAELLSFQQSPRPEHRRLREACGRSCRPSWARGAWVFCGPTEASEAQVAAPGLGLRDHDLLVSEGLLGDVAAAVEGAVGGDTVVGHEQALSGSGEFERSPASAVEVAWRLSRPLRRSLSVPPFLREVPEPKALDSIDVWPSAVSSTAVAGFESIAPPSWPMRLVRGSWLRRRSGVGSATSRSSLLEERRSSNCSVKKGVARHGLRPCMDAAWLESNGGCATLASGVCTLPNQIRHAKPSDSSEGGRVCRHMDESESEQGETCNEAGGSDEEGDNNIGKVSSTDHREACGAEVGGWSLEQTEGSAAGTRSVPGQSGSGLRTKCHKSVTVRSGGTLYYSSGERYDGELVGAKRHGQGTHTLPSGECYSGVFLEDQLHGQGTFCSSDGIIEEGEWWGGTRVDIVSL